MYSSLLASVTQVLWKALESYGCNSRQLFQRAGLDPNQLHDPNARYPYQRVRKLWKLAIEETQDPCIALVAARCWHPTNFHGLGFAWLASASLKEAIERAIRYFRIVTNDPEQLRLIAQPNSYELIVDASDVVHRALDQEYDLLLALLVDMCRNSCGSALYIRRVTLQRPKPSCANRFEKFFTAPVEFSAAQNKVIFGKPDLEQPLPTANAELALANEQIVRQYLARMNRGDILMKVKTLLIQALPSGHVTEETIAQGLHMSQRSLQRRLREEGHTYKELLDETRRDLAAQYIKMPGVSINEITYLLGFSEPSNFSRAFKRWTGVSPSEYRQTA